MYSLHRLPWLAFLLATTLLQAASAAEETYNPLDVADVELAEPLDLDVVDDTRDRTIPVRIFLPAEQSAAPVVLFSHGLGGTRTGNAFMGKHWAARGYVAVFLQHPGSDESVWREKPLLRRMDAMRDAANAENFFLRVKDIPAVLDALDRWNKSKEHQLAGRLDMDRVGMSGHSFGAVTTQAVSGQRFTRGGVSLADQRIKAAIAFSPSIPRNGDDAKQAFSSVTLPWLLMTGTKDSSFIGGSGVESRLKVYPELPPGSKYELVLDHAEHSAFTDRVLPGDRQKRNPNHHRAILALSTAFWDAYLRDDKQARAWLDGDGPRGVLEEADRWQKK